MPGFKRVIAPEVAQQGQDELAPDRGRTTWFVTPDEPKVVGGHDEIGGCSL
jgi:hypothetical protein